MDDMARLHLLTATNCTNITFPSIPQLHWKSPFHFSPSRLPDCSPAPVTRDFTMSETPFRPREQLYEKQKIFQSIHKHTYLKGPFDKITSVAIPAALAATSLFLIGRGIYNMSHGIGKKE